MTQNVYVDESKAGDFIICAVQLSASDAGACRRVLKGLVHSGSRRVHMKSEGPERRAKVIRSILTLPISARLYVARPCGDRKKTLRKEVLTRLVEDLRHEDVSMICLETDASVESLDRQWLYAAVRRVDEDASLRYEHRSPHDEPLLWLPDVIAWSYARGGKWRSSV